MGFEVGNMVGLNDGDIDGRRVGLGVGLEGV